jgi:hypothetical protein
MDADYYELKKYIYNKLKKHMKDEHDSVRVEKKAEVVEPAAVDAVDAVDVVEENADHLVGNSVSAVMNNADNKDDEEKNDNKEDDGIIIMLDDMSCHSSDNE